MSNPSLENLEDSNKKKVSGTVLKFQELVAALEKEVNSMRKGKKSNLSLPTSPDNFIEAWPNEAKLPRISRSTFYKKDNEEYADLHNKALDLFEAIKKGPPLPLGEKQEYEETIRGLNIVVEGLTEENLKLEEMLEDAAARKEGLLAEKDGEIQRLKRELRKYK